jgi:hypothetical protein
MKGRSDVAIGHMDWPYSDRTGVAYHSYGRGPDAFFAIIDQRGGPQLGSRIPRSRRCSVRSLRKAALGAVFDEARGLIVR